MTDTSVSTRSSRIIGVEALRERIPGASFDVVQIERGRLGGTIGYGGTTEFACGFAHYDRIIRSSGTMPAGKVFFATVLMQKAPTSVWGRSVMPGDVALYANKAEMDLRSSPLLKNAWISIDIKWAMSIIDVVEPELMERLETSDLYRQNATAQQRICRRMGQIEGMLAKLERGDGVDIAAFVREAFLECIAELNDRTPHPESRHLAMDRKIVRRAEELAYASEGQSIDIADLCAALRVSRRTLQRAFMRRLAVSPKRYLQNLKLCAAREALVKGAQGITGVATQHGFYELGRFAQRYHALFGERPSETVALHKQRPT